MAQHAENHIVHYLSIPKDKKDDLGAIRHWSHLKVAFDKDLI